MTLFQKIKYAPFFLLSLIPFKILYLLSDFLFIILYYIIGYRRKVVQGNIILAFPELVEPERKIIEKKFYKHFCDLVFDTLKVITIKPANFKRRFKILNPEIVDNYKSENKSFILYSGHLGDWEWMAALPLYFNFKNLALYLPLRNKYFDGLINGIRERFGVECIEAGRAYKALMNFKNANINTFTIFIADQSPHKDAKMHWVKFLNQETPFNIGINAMAMKMKQVVLFPHFRQKARGYYEIELIEIWDGKTPIAENQIIEIFANKLEEAIRETPHLWLWTHRRWKLKKVKSE